MPDSSVFLSGSDINNHVGASVPVPTDSAGRTFPGGVLCPLCSHIHIPNGITPEGPEMVRLPWGECHPKEAPRPLPNRYQLLRPDFLLQIYSHTHAFLCVPGLYGLYREVSLWEHLNPRVPLCWSSVLPCSLSLLREKTPRQEFLVLVQLSFCLF